MQDKYSRKITYLRLSVTDLCNLRCIYCMPEGGVEKKQHREILSIEEIEEISRACVDCGIKKIRVTGGEPLVRHGIEEICRRLSAIEGVEELCMTTNGILLPKLAPLLKAAGVGRLNISLDTLNEEKYKRISRVGTLESALKGIYAAKEAGFERLKLNVVLMGGVNDDEIPDLVRFAAEQDMEVRFIELMPIGECSAWDTERFIECSKVLQAVPELEETGTQGVARIYRIPGKKGSVGLISPMSSHFCPSCNRIRVTADGKLKPCLHSSTEINLRGLHGQELRDQIVSAMLFKPQRHHLDAGASSDARRNMNAIGG
jgi:cyclic pyranopterin phosphate synthase